MKPDDVTQEAWDAAIAVRSEAINSLAAWIAGGMKTGEEDADQTHALDLIFARAIMAAEQRGAEREREECAKAADQIAAGRSHQKMQATSAKKRTEARDYESMAMSAIDVSYAIRNRSNAS